MNAFFVPTFIPLLRNLSVEFPIWTNCTTPECDATASSAVIESDFNDLKTNVLGKGLRRADNFLITHLRDIEGGCMLFVANTARHENKEQPAEEPDIHNVSSFCVIDEQNPTIPQIDHDPWSIQNWKNQVPQSEFINPAMEDFDDDEESGTVEWDHSYCQNTKKPERGSLEEDKIIKKATNSIGCTNAKESDGKERSIFETVPRDTIVNSRKIVSNKKEALFTHKWP